MRAYDPVRSAVSESVEQAASPAEVKAHLESRGLVVLNIEDAAQARPWYRVSLRWDAGGHFSVPWWCRELRTLLRAGMTVVEALETLQAQAPDGARGDVQSALINALRQGKSLSRAMQDTAAFPAVLVASVKASERTSTLPTALDDYLKHDEMMVSLRKQVVSAALYPAVVVCLGALISLFLLLFVIPRFSGMYVDFQGNLSGATRMLLWVSKAIASNTVWVAMAIATVVGLATLAVRTGAALAALLSVVSRFNALQRQWDHFRLAKLYQSLALMFKGGYTLEEALTVCETLGLGGRMSAGLGQARADLLRGRGIATALSAAGLTDTVSQRLLAAGERTGSFELVLQTIADRHASAFATFIHRATRLVEPMLLLLVALIVGGIVVMMYMPIFDIANTVR